MGIYEMLNEQQILNESENWKNRKLDGWMRGTWIDAGWGGVVLIAILSRG